MAEVVKNRKRSRRRSGGGYGGGRSSALTEAWLRKQKKIKADKKARDAAKIDKKKKKKKKRTVVTNPFAGAPKTSVAERAAGRSGLSLEDSKKKKKEEKERQEKRTWKDAAEAATWVLGFGGIKVATVLGSKAYKVGKKFYKTAAEARKAKNKGMVTVQQKALPPPRKQITDQSKQGVSKPKTKSKETPTPTATTKEKLKLETVPGVSRTYADRLKKEAADRLKAEKLKKIRADAKATEAQPTLQLPAPRVAGRQVALQTTKAKVPATKTKTKVPATKTKAKVPATTTKTKTTTAKGPDKKAFVPVITRTGTKTGPFGPGVRPPKWESNYSPTIVTKIKQAFKKAGRSPTTANVKKFMKGRGGAAILGGGAGATIGYLAGRGQKAEAPKTVPKTVAAKKETKEARQKRVDEMRKGRGKRPPRPVDKPAKTYGGKLTVPAKYTTEDYKDFLRSRGGEPAFQFNLFGKNRTKAEAAERARKAYDSEEWERKRDPDKFQYGTGRRKVQGRKGGTVKAKKGRAIKKTYNTGGMVRFSSGGSVIDTYDYND